MSDWSYLDLAGLRMATAAGRTVEQMLQTNESSGRRILRWVRIDRERSGEFTVSLFESFDDGQPDFLDVYEFSPVDVDEPYQYWSFATANEALDYATSALGASIEHFVPSGRIQDVYASLIHEAK